MHQLSRNWLFLLAIVCSCAPGPGAGKVSALPSGSIEVHVQRLPKRGAATLLKSKMFHEMKRQGKDPVIESGNLQMLKERLLARLSGKTLVETKLAWKSSGERHEEVAVVGSWGQWMALHELERVNNNMWEVTVNIPVGEHEFKFLVDGVWHASHDYNIVDDNVGTTGNNLFEVLAPTAAQQAEEQKRVEIALQVLEGDEHEELKELSRAAQEVAAAQAQKDSMARMAAAARRARSNAKASDDALQRASKALAQEMARSKAEVEEMQTAYVRMKERTEELKRTKERDQAEAMDKERDRARLKAQQVEAQTKETMERELRTQMEKEKEKMRMQAEEAARLRQAEFESVRKKELDDLRTEREALAARTRGWLPAGLSGSSQWRELMATLRHGTGIETWWDLAEAVVPALKLARPEAPACLADVASRLCTFKTFPRAAAEGAFVGVVLVHSVLVTQLGYGLLADLFYVPEHMPTNLMKVSRSTIERRHHRNPYWNPRKIQISGSPAS